MEPIEISKAKITLMKLLVAANLINIIFGLGLGLIGNPVFFVCVFKFVVFFEIIMTIISVMMIRKVERNGGY